MDNDEVLGHLLKIESEAAALVNDAQTEADRRIAEAEKQNRASFEEHYQEELKRLESEFQIFREQVRRQYQEEINTYREKVSSVDVDANAFSALLNRLVREEE